MNKKDIQEKKYVIRKMSLPHCARGPRRCKQCAEAAKNIRIYLLEVYPDPGTEARPVIKVTVRGKELWLVYSVVREFTSRNHAEDYAQENGLKLIEKTI
jgi:hypothetical protein